MLITEASVATDRARRHVRQLCSHLDLVAQAHPQLQARVEWSDDHGVISVGTGRCTLRADPGLLTLRAEAADVASLRQLQQRIAGRLEQIGRRDQLTITWTPPQEHAEAPPDQQPDAEDHEGTPT